MGCLKLSYWSETKIPILRDDEMNTTLKVVSRNFGESENRYGRKYDYGARWYEASTGQ